MHDIFEDSTDNLDLDRVKDKIRQIWQTILVAEYNNEYGNMKDDDDDYKTIDQYCAENALYFPGDNKPEDETSGIVKMLEDMFDPKEELDPVSKEGKAPTYGGSQLKANQEGRKAPTTVYQETHTMTVTPKDSQTKVRSGTYTAQTGSIAPRKDSAVKRQFKPMIDKIVEELLELDKRQAIGRRKQLFRL